MREMKDSGISWIGDLPSAWATMPIKYNFTLVAGATPDSHNPDLWDGDVNWITPADFKTEDVYVKEGSRKLSEIGFKSCSTSMIPAGSIIFSKRAPIGTVAINTTELCTNQGCLGLVKKSRGLDNKYYYYVLSIYPEVFNLFGSGTTFKEISATAFGEVSLPFPPINEQHRISTYLDSKCSEFDALTEDIQSQIDTLEQYKRSVITEAVTKGLDKNVEMKESGIEWIGDIPNNWLIIPVKYFFTIGRGRVISVFDLEEDGKYPVYSSQTENDGCFGYLNTYDYSGPAITWTTDGAKAGTVFLRDGKYNCTNVCGILQLKNQYKDKSDLKFLTYTIGMVAFQNKRYDINGYKIMSNEMAAIRFAVPPVSEQHYIAQYLDAKCSEIDETISLKKQQLETLEKLKKSIIYEYVTGKKEVPA